MCLSMEKKFSVHAHECWVRTKRGLYGISLSHKPRIKDLWQVPIIILCREMISACNSVIETQKNAYEKCKIYHNNFHVFNKRHQNKKHVRKVQRLRLQSELTQRIRNKGVQKTCYISLVRGQKRHFCLRYTNKLI